jgi:DNA-binding transcriptional LysR family regulator
MHAFLQATDEARWDDVRLFLALMRGGSLAAAATRVGLDASTLSRRLAALEDSLGARLFDRTREGLAPTDAAEQLMPAAEEMEAAHGRFARDASGFEREAEGLVRLSVPPGLADAFLAPALLRLRTKHPRIRLEVDASVGLVDLTRREADLALRLIRPQSGDLVMAKVGSSRWTAMTSAARATLPPVKRWEDVDWIAWGDDLAAIPPARWLSKHAPAAVPVLKTSHIATQVAAVQEGVGVALLPRVYLRVAAIAPVRYAKALEPSVKDLPVNETWLVGHKALRSVPRVAAVWALILEEFQHIDDAGGSAGKPAARRRAPREEDGSPRPG